MQYPSSVCFRVELLSLLLLLLLKYHRFARSWEHNLHSICGIVWMKQKCVLICDISYWIWMKSLRSVIWMKFDQNSTWTDFHSKMKSVRDLMAQIIVWRRTCSRNDKTNDQNWLLWCTRMKWCSRSRQKEFEMTCMFQTDRKNSNFVVQSKSEIWIKSNDELFICNQSNQSPPKLSKNSSSCRNQNQIEFFICNPINHHQNYPQISVHAHSFKYVFIIARFLA